MLQNLVLNVDVKSLIESSIQEIRRCDIKLPNDFGFPGRERFGIDGLDVRVSQETEHLQSFRRFHLSSKSSHSFRIKNVSPQCRAHFQVFSNEKEHGFPVWRI